MSSRKKSVHFGSRSKVREFNNVSGAVINVENVKTKENKHNYSRHERKKKQMNNYQRLIKNKGWNKRQVGIPKSELQDQVVQQVLNLAGSAYTIVCDAFDRCFLRSKKQNGTRRRAMNSRRSRTRKANRV